VLRVISDLTLKLQKKKNMKAFEGIIALALNAVGVSDFSVTLLDAKGQRA
jgi:hypothetical protein